MPDGFITYLLGESAFPVILFLLLYFICRKENKYISADKQARIAICSGYISFFFAIAALGNIAATAFGSAFLAASFGLGLVAYRTDRESRTSACILLALPSLLIFAALADYIPKSS